MKLENLQRKLKSRGIEIISVDAISNIVLCHLPYNECTPYVTWEFNDQGDTFGGHYFEDIDAARDDFNNRISYRNS